MIRASNKMKVIAFLGFFIMAGALWSETVLSSMVLKEKKGIGRYLTDLKGKTLYYSKNDSAGVSACAGECLKKWPVFYTDSLIAPEGLTASDFGVITREDGKDQITYKGHPLYYYSKDKKSGDTLGNKINDVWFVATPDKMD